MDALGEAVDSGRAARVDEPQPWRDGNIGMWGGLVRRHHRLRAAAAGSPHLKAIAPVFAGTDAYHDWLFPGGCRNALGALGIWGSFMLAMQGSIAPLLADSDGRWERVWRERLDRARPYLSPGSSTRRETGTAPKAVPVEQIAVPTLLVGWRDLPGGDGACLRADRGSPAAPVGPWLHTAPDVSPFVRVDYLEELAAFFGHWLGETRPRQHEVTFYVQGGGWRHERAVARARQGAAALPGRGRTSARRRRAESPVAYVGDPRSASRRASGIRSAPASAAARPGPDDLRSLTFTTEPLPEAIEITGSPEARLALVLDGGDDVSVVVKLCEVTPDGRSSLVTTGWLRGSHRNSHDRPEAIPHGEALDYRVPLWATSYRLRGGSRLASAWRARTSRASWPTPVNPRLRLLTGGEGASSVVLPVADAVGLRGVDPTEPDPDVNRMPGLIGYEPRWTIERDPRGRRRRVQDGRGLEVQTPGRDGSLLLDHLATARVARAHPDEASVRGRRGSRAGRREGPSWRWRRRPC